MSGTRLKPKYGLQSPQLTYFPEGLNSPQKYVASGVIILCVCFVLCAAFGVIKTMIIVGHCRVKIVYICVINSNTHGAQCE